MRRRDIKSMSPSEVCDYITSHVRFAHQQSDFMMMYYQELYRIIIKYHLSNTYIYRLAFAIFDYVNRDKDI